MSEKPNKALCIAPWVHIKLRQNGDVYPCSRVSHGFSYGSIKNNSINEIWNSESIKKIRQEMLQGKPQSFCSDCFKLEEMGTRSYRNILNHHFKDEFQRFDQTDVTGLLSNETIPFIDLRFSNVCNLKCRSCSSVNSTSWFEDEKKLYPDRTPAPDSTKILKLKNLNPDFINQLYEKLPTVKSIYFAGGEPLFDENHYLLLERLIEIGRTDVLLNYNTNLSVLKFKKWNVLQLWQQFETVHISASIDAIGPALELVRKGADWNELQKNLKLVKLFLPKALLIIYPTISILNCFSITALIDYFLKNNFIQMPRQIEFNILNEPEHLNVSLLNSDEIARLENSYLDYLAGIKSTCAADVHAYLTQELDIIVKFARSKNLQSFRSTFVEETRKLDKIRDENSSRVLVELKSILNEDGEKV